MDNLLSDTWEGCSLREEVDSIEILAIVRGKYITLDVLGEVSTITLTKFSSRDIAIPSHKRWVLKIDSDVTLQPQGDKEYKKFTYSIKPHHTRYFPKIYRYMPGFFDRDSCLIHCGVLVQEYLHMASNISATEEDFNKISYITKYYGITDVLNSDSLNTSVNNWGKTTDGDLKIIDFAI